MKEITKSIKRFEEYVSCYNLEDNNIKRKFLHSYRVMKNCIDIGKSINLNERELELIQFIGLYHDIARFEQYSRYNTFNDLMSIDHGDFAIEILEKNKFMDALLINNEEKEVIKKAIKNHNKYKVEENLTKKELIFVKIIRDADKLDIMLESIEQFFKSKDIKFEIESGTISKDVMDDISKNKTILRKKENTKLEKMLVYIAFIFDFNFQYSFKYIKNNNYIKQILDQFNFKDEDTKKKIEIIEECVEKYLLLNV